MQKQAYSSLFSTIYDEKEPVGNLGRGTHYSVLRAAQFLNNLYQPQNPLKIQDFCIVWDEDHDTRLIEVVEQLYLKNMLSPVLFIGERKGGVTVILDKEFYENTNLIHTFYQQLNDVAQGLSSDPWCASVGYINLITRDVDSDTLVNEDKQKVSTYLNNIHNLWSLGQKDFLG
jgi:hypothetical protein